VGVRILVVDDSRVMRTIIRRALTGIDRVRGATIFEAADGRVGLDVVATERPHLVLSDWNMPGMNGLEFLQAINAAGHEVVFGFVTSESTPEMHELAWAHGATFLVSKPFTPASIDAALAGAL
jgi:two-component system, chemotaxis family, chemotaxis protein CheY